jgi:hypothetical protein
VQLSGDNDGNSQELCVVPLFNPSAGFEDSLPQTICVDVISRIPFFNDEKLKFLFMRSQERDEKEIGLI